MLVPRHNWLTVLGHIVIAVMLTLLVAAAVAAQPGNTESSSEPWWTQQKIRFFWGQWGPYGDPELNALSTEQLMKNLSQVGATVFVRWHGGREGAPVFDQDQARLAHKYGMRYFAILFLQNFVEFLEDMKGPVRLSVDREGNTYTGGGGAAYLPTVVKLPCPLYRPVYEEWFLKPILEAAQTGLVDGLHMDWEPYAGCREAGVCYCDNCFGTFLTAKGLELEQPVPKDQRYAWLEGQGLTDEYEAMFSQRRTEMFRELAQRIRQVKPDFIFSGYDVFAYAPEIARGLHSPDAPFFFIDDRPYYDGHTRPWWRSMQTYCKNQGYLRIPGTTSHALFGGQPQSDVSASQWMYEAAINSDGYWMLFGQELTPDMWRSFWIANRMIQATEQKVGDFLLSTTRSSSAPIIWATDISSTSTMCTPTGRCAYACVSPACLPTATGWSPTPSPRRPMFARGNRRSGLVSSLVVAS